MRLFLLPNFGISQKSRNFAPPMLVFDKSRGFMSDNELMILAQRMTTGDREAFNQIFRRLYAPMLRFCCRFVPDEDESAEIVQDLFVRLWTGREKLNINTSLESYLMRAVRNAAVSYINKVRSHDDVHQLLANDDIDSTDPSEQLQSKNLEAAYQQVLAAMPEKRREVFMASRFDGLKYAEIAEKLGISQKTVEAHIMAAIKQLREGLKDFL